MTDTLPASPAPPRAAPPGTAPHARPPLPAPEKRPPLVRLGKALRGTFDRLIASSSLVPNDPVLDPALFPWTADLRANWERVRAEAVAAALAPRGAPSLAPSLADVSPDHRSIAEAGWRSFFLWGYGYPIPENIHRCPETARLVGAIPGLNSAFFSVLEPGTGIPPHRGVSKGLITCHLGLVVPAGGDLRMRVGDRTVRWAEGEVLLFDDTYEHEVRNDAAETRVVLLVQVARPLRQPGKAFADLFLGIVRRSPFVQEARANVERWNRAVTALDGGA